MHGGRRGGPDRADGGGVGGAVVPGGLDGVEGGGEGGGLFGVQAGGGGGEERGDCGGAGTGGLATGLCFFERAGLTRQGLSCLLLLRSRARGLMRRW